MLLFMISLNKSLHFQRKALGGGSKHDFFSMTITKEASTIDIPTLNEDLTYPLKIVFKLVVTNSLLLLFIHKNYQIFSPIEALGDMTANNVGTEPVLVEFLLHYPSLC